MSKKVLIRKSGNLIDVSFDGKIGISDDIKLTLEPALTYVYVKSVYGANKRFGEKKLEFETRRLYRYDDKGRLVCGKGLTTKISNILTNSNYEVFIEDKTPVTHDRYTLNWDLVKELMTFRAGQQKCLEAIVSNDCGVINAVCGFGKSAIITMLCLLFNKAKIDVVIPGRDLILKTHNEISSYLPNVGLIGAGKNYNGRVTVVSADSLHLTEGNADILVVDEAHKLVAPSYAQELVRYRYSRNYAFTATPAGRGDGSDAKLESLFGSEIYEIKYQEAVDAGLVVPIVVEWLDIFGEDPIAGKTDETVKKRHGIWRNDIRNAAIAKKLEEYKDEQVLVLVNVIEHAVYLKQFLPDYALCFGDMDERDREFYIKNGLLAEDSPRMDARLREQMRLDFKTGSIKKVIATGIWQTGLSFDALPVLVWAGSGSSAIKSTQVTGRVSRIHKASGKTVGILIDCVDQFNTSLCSQSDARCRHYRKHGWLQTYEDGRKVRRKRIEL